MQKKINPCPLLEEALIRGSLARYVLNTEFRNQNGTSKQSAARLVDYRNISEVIFVETIFVKGMFSSVFSTRVR